MPPVFGPVSPSNARLWSCAVSQHHEPLAVRDRKDARLLALEEFLDHDRAPDAPNAPEKQSRTAASASSSVIATVTPLPSASPSALITIGAPRAEIGEGRGLGLELAPCCGRNAHLVAERLGEALAPLELRRRLARPEAEDTGRTHVVGSPATAGASGPITTRSMLSALAERDHCGVVRDIDATFSPQSPVPAFPGATASRSRGDCAIFQASACSRPPHRSAARAWARSSRRPSVAQVSPSTSGHPREGGDPSILPSGCEMDPRLRGDDTQWEGLQVPDLTPPPIRRTSRPQCRIPHQHRRIHRLRARPGGSRHRRGRVRPCPGARRDFGLSRPALLRPRLFHASRTTTPRSTR